MTIDHYLDIRMGSVMAFTGCGGKSSLIALLADRHRGRKVLVTPTAKMYPPRTDNVTLCATLRQCVEHQPHAGIQYFGLLNTVTGKLEALPENFLNTIMHHYDIVLLEADGSRGLPCKGWRAYEPAVPGYCTHTVGVITMNALGKTASADIVHRLPEFMALTGLPEGGTITMQSLEAMACAPGGMFKNSAGQQYLLVNQAEDDEAIRAAQFFLQTIKTKFPNRFTRLVYGSVHADTWQEV